jgi:D-glycero-alpha-D-manno-heptose-7-phosphate kinase
MAALGNIQELTFTAGGIEYHTFGERAKTLFEHYGLLFFTGISRNSSEVVSKYLGNLAGSADQMGIREYAESAAYVIRNNGTAEELGWILNQSWELKKKVSPHISTDRIDWLIENAKEIGCFSAKLCGAGSGGSLFLMADPTKHAESIDLFSSEGCVYIPYQIPLAGVERILPNGH